MSLIHEALKKAERDREPWPLRLPLQRHERPDHRRWWWGIATGLVFSTVTVAAIGTWWWHQLQTIERTSAAAMAPSQSLPAAAVLDSGRDYPSTVVSSLPAPPPQAVPRPPFVTPTSSADASGPLPAERQGAADAAFEQGQEAEAQALWDAAMHYYRQALALNPALVEAHNNLGNLLVRQQQMTDAIAEFHAAIALNPDSAIVHNNLGSAYSMIGEERLAIQEFMTALRLDSRYVSPHYNLASLYARRRDASHALAFLTKALAMEPTVRSWLQADPDFDPIRETPEFRRVLGLGVAKR